MKRMISCLLVMTMFMATMLIALPMSAAASEPFDWEANKTEGQTADFYTIGTISATAQNTSPENASTGGFKETALYFDVTPGETYKIYIDKLTTIFYQQTDFASWTTPEAEAQGKFANLTGYGLDATSGCASPRLFVYSSNDGVLGSAISGYNDMALQHKASYSYFDADRSCPNVGDTSTYGNLWWDRREQLQYSSFTITFTAPAEVNEIGVVFAVGTFLPSILKTPGDSMTLKVEDVIVAQAFSEVNVELGKDIALNYYAPATAGDTLKFTIGEQTKIVSGVADGLQNKFTLHLAPQYLSENVKAVLYNETTATKANFKYSVRQYLNELKANFPDDLELCALADEILAYGAAAKDFVDQKADADALVDSIPAIADFALNGNGNAVTFTSGNVFFDDTCNLIFAYNGAKAGVEWTVNDSSTGFVLAGGTVTIEGLMPTDFDTVYTVEASVGSDVTSAAYSVNAYCYAIANKAGAAVYAKNLAIATYNYGVAAEAYIGSR